MSNQEYCVHTITTTLLGLSERERSAVVQAVGILAQSMIAPGVLSLVLTRTCNPVSDDATDQSLNLTFAQCTRT
jgi:hypothetical protein